MPSFIRGQLVGCRHRRQRAAQRQCPSPHAARRPDRQPRVEAPRYDPRPAPDALCPHRHRARVPGFAPDAQGRPQSCRPTRRPASAPTTGPAPRCCSRPCWQSLRGKLPHPPLTILWAVQEEAGLFGARHVKKSLLGESEAGVQLRRRLVRQADTRRHGRLPDDDRRSRHWRATPAVHRPTASARSPSRRWPSPIWSSTAGTGRSPRAATSAPATSA